MSLEDLRKKIDEADTRIIKLIGKRIRIAEEIGKEKKQQQKQLESRNRSYTRLILPSSEFSTGTMPNGTSPSSTILKTSSRLSQGLLWIEGPKN